MWHRDNDSFFGQIKLFSVFNNLNLESGGNFYFIPQQNIKDYEFVNVLNNIFYFMEDMYQEICEESKKGIKILYMRVRSKKE